MLYRVAVETGLRRGELASLTRGSFDLDPKHPTVAVEAGYSKHRRRDVLPLRRDTAADLRNLLACKLPDAPAFNVPVDKHESVDVFRADLAAGRAAWLEKAPTAEERKNREATSFLMYVDAAGRFADFHSLRHTCGSLLAASGVHPKVAQSIMRHCTIDLFEEYGWDWSYHAYREWDGWSVEHGSDPKDHQPTMAPTARKHLLWDWFGKNVQPH